MSFQPALAPVLRSDLTCSPASPPADGRAGTQAETARTIPAVLKFGAAETHPERPSVRSLEW